jgi:hypothetical protein
MGLEIVYFTATAIILWLVADWAVDRMEAMAGRRLKHRTILFFFILLGLALGAFHLISRFTGA